MTEEDEYQRRNSTGLELSDGNRSRFEIGEILGQGGTGTVYRAFDSMLRRPVALKALFKHDGQAKRILSLQREAKVLSRLQHPNIVKVYDLILSAEGLPVLVMEFVDGTSLQHMLDGKTGLTLSGWELLDIFQQVCRAMSYAHSRNILHRDLSPSNLLLATDSKNPNSWQVKIVDFGISKIENIDDNTISPSGQIIGNVNVISPEQARSQNVSERSDIYSLGCSIYRAFHGKYPFRGETLLKVVHDHLETVPPRLETRELPVEIEEQLADIVGTSLRKDANERQESMQILCSQLEELTRMLDKFEEDESDRVSNSYPNTNQKTSVNRLYDEPQLSLLTESNKLERQNNRGQTKSSIGNFNSFGPKILISIFVAVLLSLAYFIISNNENRTVVMSGELGKSKNEKNPAIYWKNARWWIKPLNNDIDAMIATLKNNPEIKRVNLNGAPIDKSVIEQLESLPIESLDLRDTEIDIECIEIISRIPTIKSLVLSNCRAIDDKSIESLARLPKLVCLSLNGTAVTDKGLIRLLSANKNFWTLHIAECPGVTNKLIPYLMALPHIESLRLGRTSISHDRCTEIILKPGLGYLGLTGLDLEDNDIPEGAKISRISLCNNKKLTVNTLAKLITWPSVYYIDLTGTRIAENYLRTFEDQHKDRYLAVLPGSEKYDRSMDPEAYFEPYLFEKSAGDQIRIRQLMIQWMLDNGNILWKARRDY